MSRPALTFQRVAVHRAPGVSRGEAFTLEDIRPGINLVHGPNGAGKTTTALLLQELLWPGRILSGRPSAEGEFHLEGGAWRVDLEAGAASWSCDGVRAHPPELGPAETRSRYYLALDDLLRDRDADFAKQVADASRGGYDLRAAARALGYRESFPSRTKQRKALETAQRRLREAQQKQDELDREERELQRLRQQKGEAEEAKQELERLRLVREYLARDEELCQIAAQLEAFPTEMAELRGDELERVQQLRQEREEKQRQLETQQRRLEEANCAVEACGLPEDGPDRTTLERMHGICNRIESADADIRQLTRERDRAAQREAQLRERLADAVEETRLSELDRIEIGDLTGLARAFDKERARERVLQERRSWLSETNPGEHSPDAVRQGLTLLAGWLARHRLTRAQRLRLPFLVLAGLCAAAPALLLSSTQHWAWLALAPLGPLLLWLGETRAKKHERPEEAHRRDYEALGLPGPQNWTPEGVVNALDELHRRHATIRLYEERRARLDALRTEEEEHARQKRELEARRKELEQTLGLRIEVSEEWLALFAESLTRWQQSLEELCAARAGLDTAREQHARSLRELNRLLEPLGLTGAESAEAARSAVKDLDRRREERDRARSEARAAERMIADTLRPRLEEIERELRDIFSRLNLEHGDEATLSRWLEQRGEYLRLSGELQKIRGSRDDYLRRIDGDDPLLARSRAEVEARMEDSRQLAEEHEKLVQRVAAIERDLERAKSGTDMSQALAAVQEAEAGLSDICERDSRAVAGHLLTEHIRRTSAERSRPGVFRSADALLSRITTGRLRLELEEHSDPAFAAFDQVRGRRLQLDELSAGERVQLLLAVRLGFVEQEEQRARLPLLLDETLGNADDERAAAVIDALIRIAADGRQIVYFSAQADEIGKWLERLEEEGADYGRFDLQRIRGRSEGENIPLRTRGPERETVPAPEGLSHAEYGRVLGVPGLDPLRQAPEEIHLWHLVDDPRELYRLLRHGIARAGQVEGLIRGGGSAVLPGGNWIERFRARLKALEAAYAAWRTGRGLPLDRAALQDSGAVSERFMDQVCDLAHRVEWDPEALLQGLQNGEVPRWQSAKTDQLRDYLESAGYLDPRDLLDPESIRLEVLNRVADAVSRGHLDPEWIDALLARLPE